MKAGRKTSDGFTVVVLLLLSSLGGVFFSIVGFWDVSVFYLVMLFSGIFCASGFSFTLIFAAVIALFVLGLSFFVLVAVVLVPMDDSWYDGVGGKSCVHCCDFW